MKTSYLAVALCLLLVLEVMIVESDEENDEEEKRGFYSKKLKRKAKMKKYKASKASKKCRCKSGGFPKFLSGLRPDKGSDQESAQTLPSDNQDSAQGEGQETMQNQPEAPEQGGTDQAQ